MFITILFAIAFLLCIVGLWLFVCVESMIRVIKFANYMYDRINYTCDNDLPLPDVYKSWDNLKWYKIFNYNFSDFIVYKTG